MKNGRELSTGYWVLGTKYAFTLGCRPTFFDGNDDNSSRQIVRRRYHLLNLFRATIDNDGLRRFAQGNVDCRCLFDANLDEICDDAANE